MKRSDTELIADIEEHIILTDPWHGVSVTSILKQVGTSRDRIKRLLETSGRFRSILVDDTLPLRYRWRVES